LSDSIVIIPTYNERENIQRMIDTVFSLSKDFHLLIVDDSSPDGTVDIVRANQSKYPNRLFLEVRQSKSGLGAAYIHGFKWALRNPYEYIFEMDCDFSHNPADLLRLYHACHNDKADLAIGSRYVKGGKISNWPWERKLLSFGASLYVRLITWMPINDATAGFKCYHFRVLQQINFDKIQFLGYAFQIEMKYKSWLHGFRIVEVPIVFTDREAGASKMNKSIIKEAILGVWSMRFRGKL